MGAARRCTAFLFVASCITMILLSFEAWENVNQSPVFSDTEERSDPIGGSTPQMWVSMSLCLSKNYQELGKAHYPYVQVAPMAIKLWKFFDPEVKVIIFLVYDNHEKDERRRKYERIVRDWGADVVKWEPSGDVDCVLRSQLQRLWAFSEPEVDSGHIALTVDANAFPTTSTILDPIRGFGAKKVWVFQYDTVVPSNTGNFPQHIIAAYGSVWRKIVNPDLSENAKLNGLWINNTRKEAGLSLSGGFWNYDQDITTYGILKNGFCSVPRDNGLWDVPGLKQQGIGYKGGEDSQCWHGQHYQDCNRERTSVTGGCKWYHFFPSEHFESHKDVFHKLTHGVFNMSELEHFV